MKWPKTVAICVLIVSVTIIILSKRYELAPIALLIQALLDSILPKLDK